MVTHNLRQALAKLMAVLGSDTGASKEVEALIDAAVDLEEQVLWHYRATIVRIVDADTFDVDIDLGLRITKRSRLRLAGIDAWETRGSERQLGLLAKARAQEILPVGTEVLIRTKKAGKYGRWLANVFVGETHVNEMLVVEGHAKRA